MKTFRNLLAGYLIVSSVVLHLIVVIGIFQFWSAMRIGLDAGNEFARVSAGQARNTGVVKDICELQEGDYIYTAYSVEYKGKTLYAIGSPTASGVKIGDTVAVTITKHPYGPLKSLLVMVSKNGP